MSEIADELIDKAYTEVDSLLDSEYESTDDERLYNEGLTEYQEEYFE